MAAKKFNKKRFDKKTNKKDETQADKQLMNEVAKQMSLKDSKDFEINPKEEEEAGTMTTEQMQEVMKILKNI